MQAPNQHCRLPGPHLQECGPALGLDAHIARPVCLDHHRLVGLALPVVGSVRVGGFGCDAVLCDVLQALEGVSTAAAAAPINTIDTHLLRQIGGLAAQDQQLAFNSAHSRMAPAAAAFLQARVGEKTLSH